MRLRNQSEGVNEKKREVSAEHHTKLTTLEVEYVIVSKRKSLCSLINKQITLLCGIGPPKNPAVPIPRAVYEAKIAHMVHITCRLHAGRRNR